MRLSLDTNVVVRFLVNDDESQANRARKAIEDHPIWLSKTVVLETEWVLRYSYGFSTERVNFGLRTLLGLTNVEAEASEQLGLALDWHSRGMDFADALHLAGAIGTKSFKTFEQKLVKKAALLHTHPRVQEL